MINIEVCESFTPYIDPTLLSRTAEAVMKDRKAGLDVDLTIVIEDNDKLRELNCQFLGIDEPTDVLSFPANETDPETGNLYLGDVIISYPMAKSQAAKANHSVDDELQILVIHGILHLFGYDHQEEADKEVMWSIQNSLLKQLNPSITNLPE